MRVQCVHEPAYELEHVAAATGHDRGSIEGWCKYKLAAASGSELGDILPWEHGKNGDVGFRGSKKIVFKAS